MSNTRQESSVLISLAELRDIERERVEAEAQAERAAREAAAAAEQARVAAAEQAREQAEVERRAEQRAREAARAQAESEERAARVERERRSRVEAELALAQARVEAARSGRAHASSPRMLVVAIVATVLVLGGAMGFVVYRQTRHSAALARQVERTVARSGDTEASLLQKNALSRQRIAKLQAELQWLKNTKQRLDDKARAESAAQAAAAAKRPKRPGRGRARPKPKAAPVLRTKCADGDPLCGLEHTLRR